MRWGILSASIAMLAALPAGAAAAPANDDFANRQILGGPLPIEVAASNVEATKEVEHSEQISPFAAGHSVWFEWEAPATQWTTIGACGSDIPAVIGVFTGTELASLAKAASGNPAEGPHCPYAEREYTFKAVAGTDYAIGLDGNSYTGPEPVPVVTEGAIELRIEATPPPPNDDFADAADLTAAGQGYELETDEPFYFARLESYNWGATKEPGEPDHQGDPGGASAWFEWTAPATGTARMSMCCFGSPLLGIYTGGAVDALTALPTESEFPPELRAEVTAGQTYWIAVDGVYDEATGEAEQVFYSVNVSMKLPPSPDPIPIAEIPIGKLALTIPETTIVKSTFNQQTRLAKFAFSSTVSGSAFQCKLDKGDFKPCASPRTYKHLKPGRHAFRVRAVAPSGLVDESAAAGRFSIAKPQRRR
ncbi:MAG TPA: hypothetical protein VFN92_09335 [Solirubrobacterales bacterium]|nr:hypothetical protein [Solirubrobacterales bacterium]